MFIFEWKMHFAVLMKGERSNIIHSAVWDKFFFVIDVIIWNSTSKRLCVEAEKTISPDTTLKTSTFSILHQTYQQYTIRMSINRVFELFNIYSFSSTNYLNKFWNLVLILILNWLVRSLCRLFTMSKNSLFQY